MLITFLLFRWFLIFFAIAIAAFYFTYAYFFDGHFRWCCWCLLFAFFLSSLSLLRCRLMLSLCFFFLSPPLLFLSFKIFLLMPLFSFRCHAISPFIFLPFSFDAFAAIFLLIFRAALLCCFSIIWLFRCHCLRFRFAFWCHFISLFFLLIWFHCFRLFSCHFFAAMAYFTIMLIAYWYIAFIFDWFDAMLSLPYFRRYAISFIYCHCRFSFDFISPFIIFYWLIFFYVFALFFIAMIRCALSCDMRAAASRCRHDWFLPRRRACCRWVRLALLACQQRLCMDAAMMPRLLRRARYPPRAARMRW